MTTCLGTDGFSQDQFYQVVNPSLGVSLNLHPINIYVIFLLVLKLQLYQNCQRIPLAEGFNLELSPSEAISYELGWKGQWQKFKPESNLFLIESLTRFYPMN